MGEGLLVGVGIALLVEGDVVGADALVEGWEGLEFRPDSRLL